MLLRQVQAGALQGHHLRALWRRGHALEGAARAHGSHPARRARDAHLVLQGCPEPARLPARHRAEEPREGHLLRRAPHHVGRRRASAQGPPFTRSRDEGGDRRRRARARSEAARARRDVHRRARGARRPEREEERDRARREGQEQGFRGHPCPVRRGDRAAPSGLGHAEVDEAEAAHRRRARVARAGRPLPRLLRGRHGRRGREGPRLAARPRRGGGRAQGDDRHCQGPAQGEGDQAAEGRLRVQPSRPERPGDQLPVGHDPRRRSGHPARPAPDGAARRRALRDLRPQRPLPARDQPQQPVEATSRPRCTRDHHQQREAHAARGRRRAVRQRPARPTGHRSGQSRAEVTVRHVEGQAGPVPPEPARQARRLLGPFGHRRRSAAATAAVRSAEADGPRALQARS